MSEHVSEKKPAEMKALAKKGALALAATGGLGIMAQHSDALVNRLSSKAIVGGAINASERARAERLMKKLKLTNHKDVASLKQLVDEGYLDSSDYVDQTHQIMQAVKRQRDSDPMKRDMSFAGENMLRALHPQRKKSSWPKYAGLLAGAALLALGMKHKDLIHARATNIMTRIKPRADEFQAYLGDKWAHAQDAAAAKASQLVEGAKERAEILKDNIGVTAQQYAQAARNALGTVKRNAEWVYDAAAHQTDDLMKARELGEQEEPRPHQGPHGAMEVEVPFDSITQDFGGVSNERRIQAQVLRNMIAMNDANEADAKYRNMLTEAAWSKGRQTMAKNVRGGGLAVCGHCKGTGLREKLTRAAKIALPIAGIAAATYATGKHYANKEAAARLEAEKASIQKRIDLHKTNAALAAEVAKQNIPKNWARVPRVPQAGEGFKEKAKKAAKVALPLAALATATYLTGKHYADKNAAERLAGYKAQVAADNKLIEAHTKLAKVAAAAKKTLRTTGLLVSAVDPAYLSGANRSLGRVVDSVAPAFKNPAAQIDFLLKRNQK